MPSDPAGLRAAGVTFSYGGEAALGGVSLEVLPGEAVAVGGPNGSGKSTLLKLLAADLRPGGGNVCVDGTDVHRLPARERAKRIAVVPQHLDATLTFPVRMLVSMGRSPYASFLGSLSDADREAVERALRATELIALAERRFDELSGGEQQRAMLAMALAQETRYLLLDEPTVHLDLHYQYEMLELLRRLHRDRGIGVLAVLHDLNLAALYFDRLILLDRGKVVVAGKPRDVLQDAPSMSIFRTPLTTVIHPDTGVPQILFRPGERQG